MLLMTPRALRHIERNHVRHPIEGEFWRDFRGGHAGHGPTPAMLQAEFNSDPLILSYDQYNNDGDFSHHTRELVTRAGLIAITRRTPEGDYVLITAFFDDDAGLFAPNERWRAALRSRVSLYGRGICSDAEHQFIIPPAPRACFPGPRQNVRFHTETRWGFRERPGTPLRAWQMPDAWPAE